MQSQILFSLLLLIGLYCICAYIQCHHTVRFLELSIYTLYSPLCSPKLNKHIKLCFCKNRALKNSNRLIIWCHSWSHTRDKSRAHNSEHVSDLVGGMLRGCGCEPLLISLPSNRLLYIIYSIARRSIARRPRKVVAGRGVGYSKV